MAKRKRVVKAPHVCDFDGAAMVKYLDKIGVERFVSLRHGTAAIYDVSVDGWMVTVNVGGKLYETVAEPTMVAAMRAAADFCAEHDRSGKQPKGPKGKGT